MPKNGPGYASEEVETIRVIYPHLSGLVTEDSYWEKNLGYLYDYFTLLNEYVPFQVEYVEEKASQPQEKKETDIVLRLETKARESLSDEYVQSVYSLGEFYTFLFAQKNTTFSYDYYETLQGKTIGIVRYDALNEILEEFLETNQIECRMKSYSNDVVLKQALDDGEIDCAFGARLQDAQNYRVICNLRPVRLCMYANRNNSESMQILERLDKAVGAVRAKEPEELIKIYQKYYLMEGDIPRTFTRKEMECLEKQPTWKLLFYKNIPPISYVDIIQKKFSGLVYEALEQIESDTGISFEMQEASKDVIQQLETESVDGISAYLTYEGMEIPENLTLSDSYYDATILVLATDKKKYEEKNELTAAVLKQEIAFKQYLSEKYPDITILEQENPENCLDAVATQKADITILDEYVYNQYVQEKAYKEISIVGQITDTFHLCMAFYGKDRQLKADIINKALSYQEKEGRNSLIYSHIIKEEKVTLRQVFEEYSYVVVRFMIVVAIIIAVILIVEKIRKDALLDMLAYKDSVTGLIKWDKFKQEAENILKTTKDHYAMIQFDIDKFKVVNDTYGILGGNSTLRYVGMEVSRKLGKNEMITRTYADVFCVLFSYSTEQEIIDFIEEVKNIIQNSTVTVNLKISFGIYKIGEEAISIDLMNDRAGLAKKSIKGNNVHYYAFYDSKIRDAVIFEKSIEDNMETALQMGQFEVYLQPQYGLKQKKYVSAEALVRWKDPIHGVIGPDVFIDIFEKNSFILKLDYYVWKRVCMLIRRWLDERRNPIPIAINVSRVHLKNENVVEELTGLVEKYGIPLEYLEIEITEESFLENQDTAISIIQKLRKRGFTIAIDDFGSGYSSLSLLNILPIDILKIDREFLRETSYTDRGRVVIQDMIALAKHLNMKVVCEGVELKEQIEFLEEVDCDLIQGFYFSRPKPIQELEKELFEE